MSEPPEGVSAAAAVKHLNVRQAAFIGVGSMVGAGIFALLGAAGEVAGAAVWLSFVLAGVVAILQGYSFAKLGARCAQLAPTPPPRPRASPNPATPPKHREQR